MKMWLMSFIAVIFCCVGCMGTHRVSPRYTVGLDEVLQEPLIFPVSTGLKVSLAPHLATMIAPFVYHPDGRVTNYTDMTYYTTLPLALEHAIEKASVPSMPGSGTTRLQLIITEYGIDLRGDAPQVVVGLKGNLVCTPHGLVVTPNAPMLSSKGTVTLPQNYTAQDVRKAFAKALAEACHFAR